jgi:hypothetical protein
MKKIFEEQEVSSGNATGQGGGASLPFNKGFYQSGNSGEPGITFTPTGERTLKTYKMMKHSKKNLKKKMKHLKAFEMWTSNVTDNFEVNYGDKKPKPKISDIVENTKKFIEDNFNKIKKASANSIDFEYFNASDPYPDGIKSISVDHKNDYNLLLYSIKYILYDSISDRTEIIDITKEEFDHFLNFMYNIYIKYRQKIKI